MRAVGPFLQHPVVLPAELLDVLNAAALAVVHGDEKRPGEEEIGVVRLEGIALGEEINAVEDDVQDAGIGLDLGVVDRFQGILDGERVQTEDHLEHPPVCLGGLAHVGPHPYTAVGLQPLRLDCFDLLGAAVAVNVVRNQSPTLTASAACAAARRATGMR